LLPVGSFEGREESVRKALVLVAIAAAMGCGSSDDDNGTPRAATPTFAPPAGTYTSPQSVTIASATPGAAIYYTTDGSDPTMASAAYASPVAVSASSTLKAIATASGFTQSAIGSAAYTISASAPQAATPTFSPGSGSYTTAQAVTISCATAGATIYYTTDGAEPTTASNVYSSPIQVSTSQTVRAIATAAGYTPSAVGSATYAIGAGGGGSFAEFCSNAGTANLDVLATCLHANPEYLNSLADTFVLLDDCAALQKEIDAGRVSFDAASASACAAALGSSTCDQLATATLPAACESVLTGSVDAGGACYIDEDCANGWCNASASACPGTCQAFVQTGGSCAVAGDTRPLCAPGLDCNVATDTCQALSAANGPCPCQDGLWCDTAGGSPGTCRAPQTSGACDDANFDQCALGYACIGTPATCQSLVGLGGDCAASPEELCGLGYVCDAGTNTCVSWPKVGDACSDARPLCIGGYCDLLGTQTCLAYKQVGEACTFPIDLLACEPGSSCDQATSRCVALAPICVAP
jgi:hypothetical protein